MRRPYRSEESFFFDAGPEHHDPIAHNAEPHRRPERQAQFCRSEAPMGIGPGRRQARK